MFTSHLVTSFNPIRGYLTLAVTRIKPNRETGGTEVGPYGSSTYVPLKCAPSAFQSLSFTQFYLKTTNLIITFNIWWNLKHLCAFRFSIFGAACGLVLVRFGQSIIFNLRGFLWLGRCSPLHTQSKTSSPAPKPSPGC